MQPVAYPVNKETLAQIWRTFMKRGKVDWPEAAILDQAVLQSWRRCAYRLDPTAKPHPTRVGEQALASILRAQNNLITVATPFMEDIYQHIEGTGCAILLADGTACVHTALGDQDTLSMLKEIDLRRGTYWAEGQLGTNALGMVLMDAMPVLVVGPEHFYKAYHRLCSTAAPIHDVRGRIVGIMAIIGPFGMVTPHTLALVMAAARAISNQLHTDWFFEEASLHLSEVNTVLGAISEGVIAWDEVGIIRHANEQAGRILDLKSAAIVGRPLKDVLELPAALNKAVESRRELRDVEISLSANGQRATCLASLRFISEGAAGPAGYVLMLRPIEQVRELVHQQMGSRAILTLDDLAFQSSRMRKILRQARIAARGAAPVLIHGEGGVGKNHLARAIHHESARGNKPFVVIDCRAIPHELMTSEFLGHERDTGTLGRPSKFELAHEGTLLLDQIETLSLELQTALLRVLETGHVLRLGGNQPIPLDVRVMAVSTADLGQLVTEGSFSPHLYYRFGVFNIHIPPVRDRQEDIPLLAERFLARIAAREERAYWIDDEAMTILCRYPWPGNVREMESVLERAVSHSQDDLIRLVDLPDVVRSGRVILSDSPHPAPVLSVAEAEREAILRAGWANQGRVTEMADQLGIGRTTLWRKMKRLNISPSDFRE